VAPTLCCQIDPSNLDHPLTLSSFIAFCWGVSSYFFQLSNPGRTTVNRFLSFPYWAVLLVFAVCLALRSIRSSHLFRVANTYYHSSVTPSHRGQQRIGTLVPLQSVGVVSSTSVERDITSPGALQRTPVL